MGAHPLTDAFQAFRALPGNAAVGLGTDVQQQVAAFGCRLYQQADQLRGGFIVEVLDGIAPGLVHGLAHLHGHHGTYLLALAVAGGVLAGEVALEHLEIFSLKRGDVVVVANQAVRLEGVDEAVELRHPPVEGNLVPFVVPDAVEPQSARVRILGEQFLDLGFHKPEIAVVVFLSARAAGFLARFADGIIFADPVQQRIVQVQAETALPAGFFQLAHDIAAEGRPVHDVIGRCGGLEQGKTIVVARGKSQVARTCVFESGHPLVCIEADGIEGCGRLGVFVLVQFAQVEVPFALGIRGVETPVDEDTQSFLCEFLTGREVAF